MNYVVVTGISTGIGRSIAEELLNSNYHVIGTVRKESDARFFYKEHPDTFSHLILDFKIKDHIQKATGTISKIIRNNYLTALVNNAGIAIGGPLMHQDMKEIREQFEVNLFGLLDFTKQLLPLLGAEIPQKGSPGRIINISSTNGKISFPFIGAYSATKHALEAITDSLRQELNIYGIEVISIEPGNIDTPIWDKAEKMDLSPYAHTDYADILSKFKEEMIKLGKNGLPPDQVAKVVRKAIETKKPKTRYVISKNYFSEWILPRLLPDKILDYLIIREVGLQRKT